MWIFSKRASRSFATSPKRADLAAVHAADQSLRNGRAAGAQDGDAGDGGRHRNRRAFLPLNLRNKGFTMHSPLNLRLGRHKQEFEQRNRVSQRKTTPSRNYHIVYISFQLLSVFDSFFCLHPYCTIRIYVDASRVEKTYTTSNDR